PWLSASPSPAYFSLSRPLDVNLLEKSFKKIIKYFSGFVNKPCGRYSRSCAEEKRGNLLTKEPVYA
ncbi:MAG: hypothetical protein WBK98_03785, partial [Limnochordia bacterium]